MDVNSASMLWYRKSKPLGKVKRRVQDLRIPSSHYNDSTAVRPMLDLSHNESARLAVDCLLSQGVQGYHEMLNTDGEVDFLSELEKSYILENGKDGDTEFCIFLSDFSPSLIMITLWPLPDVKLNNPVLSEACVEVYFQSNVRAAGMKDLVRGFIRKAQLALAIVMDIFSDAELLCDLLVASRKRNVSVHLLLDHLNLNLFVSMWQELELTHSHKVSMRSVSGQTYHAKTGRKLRGQIAESFIITDWTEVLTGSYSFSWLSWQVHRSLAVLVKGSAVTSFHQEFHRLYSSSEPVPGFVTFMAAPLRTPLYITSHAAQSEKTGISKSKSSQTKIACCWAGASDAQKTATTAEMPVLTNSQGPEFEWIKADNQPMDRQPSDTQTHSLQPKPLSTRVEKLKHTPTGVSAQHDAETQVEPHAHRSKTLGHTHLSHSQSQPAGFTISATAGNHAKLHNSDPRHPRNSTQIQQRTVCYQSTPNKESHLDYNKLAADGLFFQQRHRNRLMSSGMTAGLSRQRGQWKHTLHVNTKAELQSDNVKPRTLPTPWQPANTGFQFPLTHARGHISGLQAPPMETRRQGQPQMHQPPHQSYPSTPTETAALGTQLKPQAHRDPEFFSLSTRAKQHLRPQTCQHANSPPRLNWILQSHSARPRLEAQTSSFGSSYGMRQKTGRSPGWKLA
uniref:Scaffolding anchor of CK1 domain-containing protein n=1 Tax=Echeneis naucrates TaxID=173247 RepID=A0A665TLA7_ECHNA